MRIEKGKVKIEMQKTNKNSHLSSLKSHYLKGFTLVELIIYIALVAIFVTGAILFSWDVIYGREKAHQSQLVQQNARGALSRVAYEIRRAEDINSVSPSSIQLENGANDTTITLVSGAVQITTEGSGPYNLTSNQVYVTDLTFTEFSSTDQNSKSINVSITTRQAQTGAPGQFEAEITMSETVELNSQFNDARALLVDSTGAVLSLNGRALEGITIQNSGDATITIAAMAVLWVDTAGGEQLTEIQIDGGIIEWSGSEVSSSTPITLTNNFPLTVAAGEVDVDLFEFDGNMAGGTMTFTWVLSDDSRVSNEVVLIDPGASPTPTPLITTTPTPTPAVTATPTPTPGITTCSEYCASQTYSSGICRQNAQKCSQSGETYESGGNGYCTGGASSDTCCCAP